MALDINGYSATFKAFADFATQQIDAGKSKAVARAGDTGGLAGCTITAVKSDWVGIGVGRLKSLKVANNTVRELFKKAIIEMFGSEENIPDKVRDAMKMADYDKGKPLTARRIMAVKVAIDLDGTAAALSKKQDVASIKAETRAIATDMGYVKSELPKLARAAQFLAKATGVGEADAMREVATPGSKANRLMDYGGRFMENAANFKEGLRLIDLFESWHKDLSDAAADINKSGNMPQERDYSSADTPSKLNAKTCVNGETRLAMEKFVFEDMAAKPSANLKEQDGEKIFGFKNNNASRFFGQNFGDSCTSTIANMPPAKRETVFKVFNLFCSLAEKPDDHQIPANDRFFDKQAIKIMLGRVLRHFDGISALDAKGNLTAKNVIKTCCPDMVKAGKTGNWDFKAVRDFIDNISNELALEPEEGGKYSDMNASQIELLMESTGGTLDEVVGMLKGGEKLPNAQYVSEGQLSLKHFGTVEGGRRLLKSDLDRGVGYVAVAEKKLHLGNHADFGFNFPGEERFVTNGTKEGLANIDKVGDKVEAMCGKVHPKQAASVMAMLSQSGLGVLKGGLEPYGIKSEEHSVVDFTLARDEDSGSVTIRYSSPKELPFAFGWTAIVDVDGKVATTPLRFAGEATLKSELDATAQMIANGKIMRTNDSDEVKANAANIIMESARSDRDLMALLRMHNGYVADGVAVNGSSRIRSTEKILRSLEELKANIDELRIASKGNKRLFDAGLKQIALLGGSAFKNGVITKMCEMAAKVDFASLKLRGLSASSSPETIFDAVCNMDREVRKMFKETSVMANFGAALDSIDSPGANERCGSTGMAMAFLFASADDKTLAGLKSALRSGNGSKMTIACKNLGEGILPPGASIEPARRLAISDVAVTFGSSFADEIVALVDDTLGIEPSREETAQNPGAEPEVDGKSAQKIFERIDRHALEVHSGMIAYEHKFDYQNSAADAGKTALSRQGENQA